MGEACLVCDDGVFIVRYAVGVVYRCLLLMLSNGFSVDAVFVLVPAALDTDIVIVGSGTAVVFVAVIVDGLKVTAATVILIL